MSGCDGILSAPLHLQLQMHFIIEPGLRPCCGQVALRAAHWERRVDSLPRMTRYMTVLKMLPLVLVLASLVAATGGESSEGANQTVTPSHGVRRIQAASPISAPPSQRALPARRGRRDGQDNSKLRTWLSTLRAPQLLLMVHLSGIILNPRLSCYLSTLLGLLPADQFCMLTSSTPALHIVGILLFQLIFTLIVGIVTGYQTFCQR